MKKIVWEKWIDPFGRDMEEAAFNNYDDDADEDIDSYHNHFKDNEPPVRVIHTPMGLIPYNEYTASGKNFKFWTGHANFDITEEVADILDSMPGVEVLDIFSRYRFRIGIGKAFTDDAEVMSNIDAEIQKLDQEEHNNTKHK